MLTKALENKYLLRIQDALQAANAAVGGFLPGSFQVHDHGGRNVVTEVDRALSQVLRKALLRPGEGWLSEEDPDDRTRLSKEVVWIVDPLDGTREFVDGIPEWCISVGLTVAGAAVAGGIFNPATGEQFVGGLHSGVTRNGRRTQPTQKTRLACAQVLASRQEYSRGEWTKFEGKEFSIRATGSIAYKLALVSAGLADATWTLFPKHEWDVAAGVALANSAGCRVCCTQNAELLFNQNRPLLPGLVASSSGIWEQVLQLVSQCGA
ncbi:MAG TPA: 3'(2'),5'-bisphosphate nucleotidase CysQ [Terriglobales bacterium]|nr:3'(2'),5'-bisphosphate nucleotidase CysQ [Terriglobales bacterium]